MPGLIDLFNNPFKHPSSLFIAPLHGIDSLDDFKSIPHGGDGNTRNSLVYRIKIVDMDKFFF